jgi:hypothetical protein
LFRATHEQAKRMTRQRILANVTPFVWGSAVVPNVCP